MSSSAKAWQIYERKIARLLADQLSTDLCVTPNARVEGRITGIFRQIDVLIDARHDTDNSRRIIVDAKRLRRKVDVKHVEEFLGMMEDVGATHGYLVCPAGCSTAAERRAQESVRICLIPIDCIESFDPSSWPRCSDPACGRGGVFWDGYPQLDLKLRSLCDTHETNSVDVAFRYAVGKCDRCGRFHVHCIACDKIFFVHEDEEEDLGRQCRCRGPGFWIASIEQDEHGHRSAELHHVLGMHQIRTVDRRSL